MTANVHSERDQIHVQLERNELSLKDILAHCDDISYRHIQIGDSGQRGIMVFVTNLVKTELVDATILRELVGGLHNVESLSIDQIRNQLATASDVCTITTMSEVAQHIVSGRAVFIIDNDETALSMDVLGWEHRGVEKAENEVSIRGSQQAFTENLMNNVALVRRFIRDTRLKVEKNVIGEVTHTPYIILYIDGLVDPSFLNQVKQRLNDKKIDKVLDSGNLVDPLRENVISPFPIINRTERPDRVAALLLEGRVVLFVDNSPVALSLPALLVEFLQAPEDYYENYFLQSFIRLLRYVALVMSLIVPSLYVAFVGYHHELIPGSMLPSIMSQREGIPLPTIIEVFVMEITFEILREAGLRLPRPIGSAVSIVGALVVGQAAVQAKLVMATTVIVVATTGITSFTLPGYGLASAIRLLRFPLLLITGFLGLFGFSVGLFLILIHLVSLKSFGVIYTGSLAPRTWQDVKDTLLRIPNQNQIHIPWRGAGGRTDHHESQND